MKLFLSKLLLLTGIVIIVIAYPVFVLLKTGEFIDPDTVVNRQLKERNVFHQAYTDASGYIKMQLVRKRKPEILVLGSSRVMGFRSFFFRNQEAFYNASRGAQSIQGLSNFLDSLKDSPTILIIGLDHFWFNDNSKYSAFPMSLDNNYSIENTFMSSFERVCFDISRGKISTEKLFAKSRNMGLFAIIRDEGFRYDGSFKYNKPPKPGDDSLAIFRDNFESIANSANHFEHGNKINPLYFKQLKIFLDKCKKRNIYVVAFLPPYAPAVWNKIKAEPDHYEYLFNVQQQLPRIFKRYNYGFFDYSDIAGLGGRNTEAFDGLHVSEVANLRMMIDMSKHDSILWHSTDVERLQTLLMHMANPRDILPEDR